MIRAIAFASMCMIALPADASTADGGCLRELEPRVFSPGTISGPAHDAAPAFSADGTTVWFTRSDDGLRSTILESHLEQDHWSEPTVAPFSGHWNDMEPTMSPDGRYMIFVSNRPTGTETKPLDGLFQGKVLPGGGGNLWRVDRIGHDWSEPIHLPDQVNSDSSTFAPSVSADGSVWFMRPDGDQRRFRLFRAQWRGGRFEQALPLSFSTAAATDVDPAVAADESYVIFSSSRAPARDMDLFISFHRNGDWTTPEHLGNVINSPGSDAEARLSHDGKTLYFSSERRATGDGAAAVSWNNGKYNIWSLPLPVCSR